MALEKLDFKKHSADILELDFNMIDGFVAPIKEGYDALLKQMVESKDPEYYAVIDNATGFGEYLCRGLFCPC